MYVTVPIEKSLKRRLKPFQILKIAEKMTFKKIGEENTGLNYKVPSVCACVRGGGALIGPTSHYGDMSLVE